MNKVLVSFSTYNSPVFLKHLMTSFERFDPGFPCDLLIIDNTSDNPSHMKLLELYSRKYRVEQKPNHGRAQAGYDYAWSNNKNYDYYFFMHDDSAFIRDNWLKVAVDRINDKSVESVVPFLAPLPVGKVGFQCYEWGDRVQYLRTKCPQIFRYMGPVADILKVVVPEFYQHISDDRLLYRNELLTKMNHILNIEYFKQLEGTALWNDLDKWFIDNKLENFDTFPPNERYGQKYHKFQTVSEFISDIGPMRHGYRTHDLLGDGYCQEELGYTRFWGHEYITHYGSHNLFKRFQLLFNTSEENVRGRFKDETFLMMCDKMIKNETKYVER